MDGRGDVSADDGGFFGKPLFDDPSARALSRVGIVDVGSNSVRFVVFDGAARSPAYFYNEKVMAGLGEGMAKSGRLNPAGRDRALAALRRFAILARGMEIDPLTCVATAAVREAAAGPEFQARVEAETGLHLNVIDGEEEARLSAQGVLLGWPEAEGLVCDIGGNSMELAEVSGGAIGRRVTSPLGPFRLREVKGGDKALGAHIQRIIEGLAREVGTHHQRIYLVGGSWRAFARIDMERRGYPLTVLHEYRMSQVDVQATTNFIARHTVAELRAMTGIGQERMALIHLAAPVLSRLATAFDPSEIDISSYGIREGLLYEQMPDRLRRRDPLIEACRYAERTMARMPGFGKKLYAFLLPIFADAPPELLRLVKAACLLHDTTWRAHPDYRAEVCFDNATRANLGGLSHPERVFLGLSLLHRYKNSREGSRLAPLFALLTGEQIEAAEVLGKAMRFGAMFSIGSPEEAGTLGWDATGRTLTLDLTPEGQGLFGEVAAARFQSLATSLRARTEVRPAALT
jgi:exopolyphosphatase/guanosine-5'-triphosphate,3'-diphosphate pyrophosphatase